MRIVFRTDAGSIIGTGHLMRCLALANGLRAEGAECEFLCRRGGLGALAERIGAAGHRLLALPEAVAIGEELGLPQSAQASRWLPGGWRNDATACLTALEGQPAAEWLVVDHYALDSRWETAMRPTARRIMAIDDLADRPHDCDLLLDQNVLAESECGYRGLISESCLALLGPKYALLRPEFAGPPDPPPRADAPAADVRLLIMFGGSDPEDLALRAVRSLVRIGWCGPVDVVAGPLYAKLGELAAAVGGLRQACLHAPSNNVAELMRSASLALGSPGVASWERCACATPSIVLSVADNQVLLGESLGKLGAHWYLGLAARVLDEELDAALVAWTRNPLARHCMSSAAVALCDGRGVRRVVQHMMVAELLIRRASQDDARLVFGWRNDERTRRYFFDPAPIELSAHLTWFYKTLHSDDSQLLIVSRYPNVAVACVRLDYLTERAKLSVYVDPGLHGQGLGVNSIKMACSWLRSNRQDVKVVEADVLSQNEASQKAFLAAGFRQTRQRYEHLLAFC